MPSRARAARADVRTSQLRPGNWKTAARAIVVAVALLLIVPIAQMDAKQAFSWDPPELINPVTIALGSGPTFNRLHPERDYIIRLPDTPKVGRTMLEGGRNVVIQGGHVTVPPGGRTDTDRRGIYIKNATGIVHIEGVVIDGDDVAGFDAISISAPRAIVQIVNVRVEGVTGTAEGFHGDIVQPFGGVRELRIDHLTGSSQYQGLYLAETLGPIELADIRNVNLYHLPNAIDATTYLIWLPVDRSTCIVSYPVNLSNIFVEPRQDQDVTGFAVWPNSYQPDGCEAAALGESSTWPSLAEVTGEVWSGVPPEGDFVPAGSVGLGYLSPNGASAVLQPRVDPSVVAQHPDSNRLLRASRRSVPVSTCTDEASLLGEISSYRDMIESSNN